MTPAGDRGLLARIWTSWVSLTAAVLLLGLIGGALGWELERQAHDQVTAGAVGAGQLIAATTVGPGLSAKGLNTKTVDAALAGIMTDGGVAGVTVWAADGTVLYHRGVLERHGPRSAAFRSAIGGGSPVDFFRPAGRAAPSSLDVLVPFGQAQAGPAPMVVGVTMPSGMIVDLTTWAAVKLLVAIILGGIGAVVCVFMLQRRLRRRSYEATHDTMTGLGNRSLLEAAAAKVIRQGPASLLLMDLDGFKRVNDHLGHAVGDQLLVAVADALRAAVRPGDLLVRLGGDEFAVLLPGAADDAARVTAERLLTVVQRQFVVSGVSVEVDASIGIAVAPANGEAVGELLSAADVAMYRAKRDRLGVCALAECGPDAVGGDLTVLVDLRRAISDGELELHYQPALGTVAGKGDFVEALVRWRHPEKGLVMPCAFIPLAEETALIHPLTEWVINEAVRQCAQWRLEGLPVIVAVNVSPRSLVREGLVQTVVQTLARHQLPAAALHIEVTESAIIARPEIARDVLGRLQALGVTISIDDFGAGYTSLAHLKRMPVEVLKIDRMFVQDLLNDQPDEAIVSSVIELGHRLGMTVVAEGVEDQATLDRLVGLGCDVLQGYHISRPAAAAATTAWLRHHDHLGTAALTGSDAMTGTGAMAGTGA